MTYKRRINVRGIIFKDGKLFSQQLTANKDEPTRNYWCTPGGGMDDGESLTEGLHREMIEETGIAPVIGRLLFIQQFYDGNKEQLEFFFHIENADDYQTIDLTTTSHGIEEVEVCDFVDPATTDILPAFLRTIDIAGHIAGTHDVHISTEM